uniref:TIP41-like protein n=1 Tax=Monodon monoceros TaxID=40151 RepID=A0A8C6B3P2_MONMO
MMIHGFQSSHWDFSFRPWKLTASKTHIMKSADAEKLTDELHMPSLPEMMFGDNVLRIQHGSGFGIEFNATDALRCVKNDQGMFKLACAKEWQESRTEGNYKGTLLGESLKLKVVPTTDHIDIEKLKAREQIKFFEEVLLFEDELHDHGVSSLSVKIRVTPSSFFLLLWFFLRIDGVLIRMNDTRLYHEFYELNMFSKRHSLVKGSLMLFKNLLNLICLRKLSLNTYFFCGMCCLCNVLILEIPISWPPEIFIIQLF